MTESFDYRGREMSGTHKTIRVFLVGVLCGVIIAAVVTFVFAIPANSDYWRMEIWKRGGAVWTFDKNGRCSWKWLVEPIRDTPRQRPATVPASPVNVRTEHL
jgi:hypothetical protein